MTSEPPLDVLNLVLYMLIVSLNASVDIEVETLNKYIHTTFWLMCTEPVACDVILWFG